MDYRKLMGPAPYQKKQETYDHAKSYDDNYQDPNLYDYGQQHHQDYDNTQNYQQQQYVDPTGTYENYDFGQDGNYYQQQQYQNYPSNPEYQHQNYQDQSYYAQESYQDQNANQHQVQESHDYSLSQETKYNYQNYDQSYNQIQTQHSTQQQHQIQQSNQRSSEMPVQKQNSFEQQPYQRQHSNAIKIGSNAASSVFDVKQNNSEIKEVWDNTIAFGKKVIESEQAKKMAALAKQMGQRIAESAAAQYIKKESDMGFQQMKQGVANTFKINKETETQEIIQRNSQTIKDYTVQPRTGKQPQSVTQQTQHKVNDDDFETIYKQMDFLKQQVSALNRQFVSYLSTTQNLNKSNQVYGKASQYVFPARHYYSPDVTRICKATQAVVPAYHDHTIQLKSVYEEFLVWAKQFGVCTKLVNDRQVALNKVQHYEQKNQKLKRSTGSDTRSIQKLQRNVVKQSNACDAFERVNRECLTLMKQLVNDKQQYLNPVVTRFIQLNHQFFKRCNLQFQLECNSIDTEGQTRTSQLYKEEVKDFNLHRLEVLEQHDQIDKWNDSIQQSMSSFEPSRQQYSYNISQSKIEQDYSKPVIPVYRQEASYYQPQSYKPEYVQQSYKPQYVQNSFKPIIEHDLYDVDVKQVSQKQPDLYGIPMPSDDDKRNQMVPYQEKKVEQLDLLDLLSKPSQSKPLENLQRPQQQDSLSELLKSVSLSYNSDNRDILHSSSEFNFDVFQPQQQESNKDPFANWQSGVPNNPQDLLSNIQIAQPMQTNSVKKKNPFL